MNPGEYWICGKAGLGDLVPDIKPWPILIKIEADGTHLPDKYSWGIERWAIMLDTWEVIDDEADSRAQKVA